MRMTSAIPPGSFPRDLFDSGFYLVDSLFHLLDPLFYRLDLVFDCLDLVFELVDLPVVLGCVCSYLFRRSRRERPLHR